jgi:hypothetical protein
MITKDSFFGSGAKTFGFLALISGACGLAVTALGIVSLSTSRMCLAIFPPKCYGGVEATLTNTGSIFNIYFLIFWIGLTLVGLAYFSGKVVRLNLLKK